MFGWVVNFCLFDIIFIILIDNIFLEILRNGYEVINVFVKNF